MNKFTTTKLSKTLSEVLIDMLSTGWEIEKRAEGWVVVDFNGDDAGVFRTKREALEECSACL